MIRFTGIDFDSENARSIAIPMRFDGDQPNAFGVDRAESNACEAGELIGDTRRGGSCNFEQVRLIPHCNGTHTECVGHITTDRVSVLDCLNEPLSIAALVTVEPEAASDSTDRYVIAPDPDDRLITRRSLESAFASVDPELQISSLIVRTLPNDESKLSRTYADEVPAYFSSDAMTFIVERRISHLLTDLPSIDRIYDSGKLSNHRIFWGVEQGSTHLTEESRRNATVTELIFVPNPVEDGVYLLNLQIAPFAADAAPSNPVIFVQRK